MPIRIPRTTLPQEPQGPPAAPRSSVVPVQPLGNPAALAARPAAQAGDLAGQLLREERDREIVTRLSELDIERRRSDAAIVDSYGERRGKAAVEARAEVFQALQQNARRVREGIQDREVAALWTRHDQALSLQSTLAADRHYRQQNQNWQADTLAERAQLLASTMERGAFGDGYDPTTGRLSDEAERTRSAYLDTIRELGGLLGWSDERVTNTQRQADSEAFGGALQQLIDQERTNEAEIFLAAHRDLLDPRAAAQADGRLQRARRKEQLQEIESDAQHLAARYERHYETIEERLAQLDERFNAGDLPVELRDETERRLIHRHNQQRQLELQDSNEVLERAQQWAKANRGQPLSAEILSDLERTGQAVKMDLFLAQGGQWIRDERGLQALLVAGTPPGQASLRSLELPDLIHGLRPHLDDRGLLEMVERWHEAHKLPKPKAAPADRLSTMLRIAAQDIGMLPTDEPITALQRARFDRLELAVQRRAEGLAGPDGVVTEDVAKQAIQDEMANRITTPAGETIPFHGLLRSETEDAYFETDVGMEVMLQNIPPQVRERELEWIRVENDRIRQHNRTAPPERQVPLVDETLGTVANRFAAERRKEIIEREREERRQRGERLRRGRENPWDQYFGSPWRR